MRTDISEDPKGDPTKILPDQPIPDARQQEGIEPLLPPQEGAAPPPRPGKQTEGDGAGAGGGVASPRSSSSAASSRRVEIATGDRGSSPTFSTKAACQTASAFSASPSSAS
jgi:hypothetical protein